MLTLTLFKKTNTLLMKIMIYSINLFLEGAGRDLCCVISSLAQLLLDPHFRTITGFQSLLQKEWIAGGHPFCDRLGHIVQSNSGKVFIIFYFL